MSYSEFDLSEAEQTDADYAQGLRNANLADDLKARIASAVRQWMYANDVQLSDPMWGGFAKRSQECLQTVIVAKLNDFTDELCEDYL